MEAKGHDRMRTVCMYECMGMAMFVFSILNLRDDFAIPFALMAVVILFGGITGGHFNPAVTLGVFVQLGDYSKNLPVMLMLIGSQFVGALFAILINFAGNWKYPNGLVPILAPKNPITGLPDNYDGTGSFDMDWAVLQNETICTFLFVAVILMVKNEHTAGEKKGVYAAMCVCATLLGVISSTGPIGACCNPAVTIGLTVDALIRYQNCPVDKAFMTHYLYAYTIGPIIGGLLAGLFFIFHRKLHEPDDARLDEKRHHLVNSSDSA